VVHLHPRIHERAWKEVSTGLPHAFFFDLHYNAACDVLVAAALGRGNWTITSPFTGGSTANCPALPAAAPMTPTAAQQVTATPTAVPVRPTSAPKPPISAPHQ
jgi:hypothetical protein